MDNLKTMAISAGFVGLLLLFLPTLQDSVTSSGANSSAFNATDAVSTSVIELSAFPVLAVAIAFMLVVVRGFS
jgi:hypothetical protein